MNQTTAFNPHFVCKLLDGSLARFARSDGDHWAALCEEIKAPKQARLRAELDAAEDIKPVQRLQLIEDIDDIEITFEEARRLAIHSPKWTKRHLVTAYKEAAGATATDTDALAALKLIPFQTQQSIASEIAMIPVVKGQQGGTEESPLVVGADLDALRAAEAARLAAEKAARDSIGETPALSSGDAIPAATQAA